MNTLAALSILSVSLAAAPVPAYQTTPTQVVQNIRYNAALTDYKMQDHVVEVTGRVDRIEKDGVGNYVAIMEVRIEEPAAEIYGTLRFTFDPSQCSGLASVAAPTDVVTIRGNFRFIRDQLRRVTVNRVTVDVLDCELVPVQPVARTR